MKKITEKWNLWVPKQYTDALFIVEKSTFAATVHSMNSSRIPPKCVKTKKKKKRTKRRRRCSFSESKRSLT